MLDKEVEKYHYKARHRANEVYKVAQPCIMLECGKLGERHHPTYDEPERIVWLCTYHHKQVHRKHAPICLTKRCDRKHHSGGYCKLHYNQMRRADPLYRAKEYKRNLEYKRRMGLVRV